MGPRNLGVHWGRTRLTGGRDLKRLWAFGDSPDNVAKLFRDFEGSDFQENEKLLWPVAR
jgi:hypothetical protein